ncbi:hypothetical protein ES702_00317 [subsurface metagenome]
MLMAPPVYLILDNIDSRWARRIPLTVQTAIWTRAWFFAEDHLGLPRNELVAAVITFFFFAEMLFGPMFPEHYLLLRHLWQ